jgi:hypothetical protein
VAEHELIDRLFLFWDRTFKGAISLQDVIDGLGGVLMNDMMANIAWFFTLHDNDKDGYLTKDEVLQLSESLLFIFRHEPGDQYLAAVSRVSHLLRSRRVLTAFSSCKTPSNMRRRNRKTSIRPICSDPRQSPRHEHGRHQ